MAIESVTIQHEVNEALARLCNAECMLNLAIKAHDDTVVGGDEWTINEALHGVRRLLDGVYCTLNDFASAALDDTGAQA